MKWITWIVFSGEITLLVWIVNRKKQITYSIKCQLQSRHLANINTLLRISLLNHTQVIIPEIPHTGNTDVNIKLCGLVDKTFAKTDVYSITFAAFFYVMLIFRTLWLWNIHEWHVYTSIYGSSSKFFDSTVTVIYPTIAISCLFSWVQYTNY